MCDFKRITLFCLENRLSKHKMTIFSKNLRGGMAPLPHPGYAYGAASSNKNFIKSKHYHVFHRGVDFYDV